MKKRILYPILAVALMMLLVPAGASAGAITPTLYTETWGPEGKAGHGDQNTVDVFIVDTEDGWLQWTYIYPVSTTHLPKMTVSIAYPNGFGITTYDDGSHDGWYYAPDVGTVVRFADYSGGTHEDWAVTSAVDNELTVRIKKSALYDYVVADVLTWHGYANVNGNQVWIEMDQIASPWAPTGSILLPVPKPVRAADAFDVFVRFGYDSTRYIGGKLAGSIEAAGTYNDAQYMLYIPAGCKIDGPVRINWMWFSNIEGNTLSFVLEGDAVFSLPCTLFLCKGGSLYQDQFTGEWLGSGTWVEVGTFSSIVGGEAHLD